jgi:hypothetical protein
MKFLKELPLSVKVAIAILTTVYLLMLISIPGLAIGFGIAAGIAWSAVTIITYVTD